VKLGAVFSPRFQYDPQWVFHAQFALSTPFSPAIKSRTQYGYPLFKRFKLNPTAAFESSGFKLAQLFIGHNFSLT
jgi:hypothetical protein